jgi:cytochrome c2
VKSFGLLLLLWAFCVHADNSPLLRFEVSGKTVKTVTLTGLKKQLQSYSIALKDPQYRKAKNYRAFALQDLLNFGYGEFWRTNQVYSDIVFRAADGYEAVATLDKIKQPGGYLAYEDLDVPGWEPVGREEANPGPYYLVWTGAGQTTQHAYPWPWQVVSLNLIRFSEHYPKVYPQGATENSAAYRGFLLFKARCIRCHAMDRQGGKIGPDLNAPRNILAYRDAATVKAYIRRPSQFRYTQMPDHSDLSESDLDDLIAYFKFQQSVGEGN